MGFDKDEMAFGPKSFRYLDDLIHSGTKEIVLDSDIVLCDGERSEYWDGIRLDVDGLAIDGNGHAIDARGKARIFCCTGKRIALKNASLRNGYSMFDGGAIFARSGLTIDEATFTGNISKKNGGAICNIDGGLSITGSSFKGNEANKGGAIFSNDSLTISASAFTENTARGIGSFGGAICEFEGKLSITESEFDNNTARHSGGAIFAELGEMAVISSTFTQNAADFYGGAISNNDNDLTITESAINSNTAARSGGAIYVRSGEVTIIGSALNNNAAQENGGAISNDAFLTIIESELMQNAAKLSGGAVFNRSRFSTLTIKKSALINNVAQDGGAICNEDGLSTLTIIKSAFSNNVAQDGGAINLKKPSISFESQDCTFRGNEPDDVSEYDVSADSEWISRKIVF